tara:strand:- start:275 stop:499 length:225 start_codon:yes stop_codon:yes gene_type:complete
MNNIKLKKEQLDRTSRHMGLIGAILREGLEEEGLSYLKTAGGKMWCTLTGVNADNLRRVIRSKSSGKFNPNALI